MQLTDILAQMGGLQAMARELGVSESQAASGASAAAGDPGRLQEAGAGAAFGPGRTRRPARPARRRRPARRSAGPAADERGARQRRAGTDLRFQGREPRGCAERFLADRARHVAAEEDAADAGDGGRGLIARQRGASTSAQASEQPAPQGGGGLGDLLGSLLGGQAAGGGRGRRPGRLASMLDLNRDGNPLDDILQMVGKAMR